MAADVALDPAAGQAAAPLAASDATYRKIVWRILPILVVLWICAWLDRTNIGFAKLQMSPALGLSEAAYGFGAGVFFLGYLIFEVPSNLLMLKIGARRTLTRIAIGWGVISILMMFTQSALMFYVLRFFLGVFEAGMYPGGLLYLTMALPAARRGRAIAIFTMAGAVSGIFGGPLAGLLLTRFDGLGGLAGWQWLFLVEGVLSVVLGGVAWFVLTDDVRKAPWLTAQEQAAVSLDLQRDQTEGEPRQSRILSALRHPTLWLFCLLYICNATGYTALSFWGPTILHDAGVADPAKIGWIISGVSLVSAAGMYLAGISSDRTGDARWHFAIAMACCALGMFGLGASLSSVGWSAIALAWTYVAASSAVVVFWNMPGRVFSGAAAAVIIGLISSVSNVGGFFAPTLLGAIKDATGSVTPALWGIAAAYLVAFAATIIFVRLPRLAVRAKR